MTSQSRPQSSESVRGAGARLLVLDVLRGVAILGILLRNIESFGLLSSQYVNPTAFGEPPPLDWAWWVVNHVIAEDKFITILTILFGAGIVLMARGAHGTASDFQQRFDRRMWWLLVFGLVHGLLVWPGDILAAYAICGLIAVRLRQRQPLELVFIAVLLYAAAMILWILISVFLVFIVPSEVAQTLAIRYWGPSSEMIAREITRLTSEWFAYTGERMLNALGAQLWMLASDRIFRMLGMMLLGMALFRIGFLSGEWKLRSYRRVLVVGLLVGVPVSLVGVWFNQATGWDFRYSMFLGRIANHWASVAVALAWISLAIIIFRKRLAAPACAALAAVGRLAMTNYIMQSLIATAIFYGFGLGLFGMFGYLELFGIALGIWAFQIVFSLLWRRYIGQGPLERLWRRLAG